MRYRRVDVWINKALQMMARKTLLPLRGGTIAHKFRVIEVDYASRWLETELQDAWDRDY